MIPRRVSKATTRTPKRVTTRMLARMFKAGYSMAYVARFYDVGTEDVEDRLRCWMRRHPR